MPPPAQQHLPGMVSDTQSQLPNGPTVTVDDLTGIMSFLRNRKWPNEIDPDWHVKTELEGRGLDTAAIDDITNTVEIKNLTKGERQSQDQSQIEKYPFPGPTADILRNNIIKHYGPEIQQYLPKLEEIDMDVRLKSHSSPGSYRKSFKVLRNLKVEDESGPVSSTETIGLKMLFEMISGSKQSPTFVGSSDASLRFFQKACDSGFRCSAYVFVPLSKEMRQLSQQSSNTNSNSKNASQEIQLESDDDRILRYISKDWLVGVSLTMKPYQTGTLFFKSQGRLELGICQSKKLDEVGAPPMISIMEEDCNQEPNDNILNKTGIFIRRFRATSVQRLVRQELTYHAKWRELLFRPLTQIREADQFMMRELTTLLPEGCPQYYETRPVQSIDQNNQDWNALSTHCKLKPAPDASGSNEQGQYQTLCIITEIDKGDWEVDEAALLYDSNTSKHRFGKTESKNGECDRDLGLNHRITGSQSLSRNFEDLPFVDATVVVLDLELLIDNADNHEKLNKQSESNPSSDFDISVEDVNHFNSNFSPNLVSYYAENDFLTTNDDNLFPSVNTATEAEKGKILGILYKLAMRRARYYVKDQMNHLASQHKIHSKGNRNSKKNDELDVCSIITQPRGVIFNQKCLDANVGRLIIRDGIQNTQYLIPNWHSSFTRLVWNFDTARYQTICPLCPTYTVFSHIFLISIPLLFISTLSLTLVGTERFNPLAINVCFLLWNSNQWMVSNFPVPTDNLSIFERLQGFIPSIFLTLAAHVPSGEKVVRRLGLKYEEYELKDEELQLGLNASNELYFNRVTTACTLTQVVFLPIVGPIYDNILSTIRDKRGHTSKNQQDLTNIFGAGFQIILLYMIIGGFLLGKPILDNSSFFGGLYTAGAFAILETWVVAWLDNLIHFQHYKPKWKSMQDLAQRKLLRNKNLKELQLQDFRNLRNQEYPIPRLENTEISTYLPYPTILTYVLHGHVVAETCRMFMVLYNAYRAPRDTYSIFLPPIIFALCMNSVNRLGLTRVFICSFIYQFFPSLVWLFVPTPLMKVHDSCKFFGGYIRFGFLFAVFVARYISFQDGPFGLFTETETQPANTCGLDTSYPRRFPGGESDLEGDQTQEVIEKDRFDPQQRTYTCLWFNDNVIVAIICLVICEIIEDIFIHSITNSSCFRCIINSVFGYLYEVMMSESKVNDNGSGNSGLNDKQLIEIFENVLLTKKRKLRQLGLNLDDISNNNNGSSSSSNKSGKEGKEKEIDLVACTKEESKQAKEIVSRLTQEERRAVQILCEEKSDAFDTYRLFTRRHRCQGGAGFSVKKKSDQQTSNTNVKIQNQNPKFNSEEQSFITKLLINVLCFLLSRTKLGHDVLSLEHNNLAKLDRLPHHGFWSSNFTRERINYENDDISSNELKTSKTYYRLKQRCNTSQIYDFFSYLSANPSYPRFKPCARATTTRQYSSTRDGSVNFCGVNDCCCGGPMMIIFWVAVTSLLFSKDTFYGKNPAHETTVGYLSSEFSVFQTSWGEDPSGYNYLEGTWRLYWGDRNEL